MTMIVERTIDSAREVISNARAQGKSIGLVPTMGGLHAGHLSLVERAKEVSDFVVVSIFVNPTQFNNPDDFENYPGNDTEDLGLLKKSGVNLVFIPTPEQVYPKGFATRVDVSAANDILCDAHRPGHFDGVATVVTKLLMQTMPDFACFGEKDYQQLFIIKRLVRDLDFPVEIIPVETVREKDGLAMSSRNARLSSKERKIAPKLNQTMHEIVKKIVGGASPAQTCANAITALEADGIFKVEYLEVRSTETLDLLDHYNQSARLFAAAWLGDVRLIDNIAVR